MASRTNGAGETVHFTRDTVGRVVEQRPGADDVSTFSYGPDGGLAQADNGHATMILERDALGRVVSETVNGRTTAYAYDPLGRRTQRVTPSGLTSSWTYDAAGRPLNLRSSAGTLDFTHDAAGRETARYIGAEVTLTQVWSGTGRLIAQTLTAGTQADERRLLQHRTYAHRADGYITEIRELTSGTRRFDLDGTGRVTGVRAHGWSEGYAYDPAGNVSHATAPDHAAQGDREFEGTLVRSAGRTSYAYDAHGRLIRKTRKLLNGQSHTWTYVWNAEDRLTDVTTPDGGRWRYAYDPLGRRISKHRVAEAGSETDRTEFSWDDSALAEQTVPDGQVTTWDYTPGTHRLVAQTDHIPTGAPDNISFLARLAEESDPGRTPRFHAVVTDSIGTPMELVSASGDLVWQHRTTLWGTGFASPEADSDSADCPLRFPGQYADPETGLHYNLHRYYDPETARYISPDPLGLEPSSNPYAYVVNALGWTDPLGLAPQCGIDLSNATPHSGRFPDEAKPNEILVRRKHDGTVTAYAVYDDQGLPIKRVDVDPNSKPHGGVPAPHTLETTRNVNPKTGEVFLKWKKMPRPARPDELPQ
nr:RHS repeat-associated core domain-containing protein [Streptomyces murinus]